MSRERRRCWGRRSSENGEKEGLQVLHMLATSPATAKFISTQAGGAVCERYASAGAGGPDGEVV